MPYQIQPNQPYERLSDMVDKLNREMYVVFAEFWKPLPPALTTRRIRKTTRKPMGSLESSRQRLAPYDDATINSSAKRDRAHRYNKECEDRDARESAPCETNEPDYTFEDAEAGPKTITIAEANAMDAMDKEQTEQRSKRRSSRSQNNKKFRYEPHAMGQGPKESSAYKVTEATTDTRNHLIVDTGASHVLFREQDSRILSHIQMSAPDTTPYAMLRAANGAPLHSIGRGMFTIKTVTVVAHIFRDEDLVTNLLGIAPFADRGCTALFTSSKFSLYHLDKIPILTGERHSHNLWRIQIQAQPDAVINPPALADRQVLLLHHTAHPDADHVRFIHACLGSPTPTTFLNAVAKGYITGDKQFPRLTTTMVRKHMPNSEASARGHLRKSPTNQPHAQSDAVSALRRHHKAHLTHTEWKTTHWDTSLDPPFDPTKVPKSTTLHFDYTGAFPERCSSGTLYLMISTWGSYIHLEPLDNLKGSTTAKALTTTVQFYRDKKVLLTNYAWTTRQAQNYVTLPQHYN